VLGYCAKSESHSRSGLMVLVRRIKIVLVLPPSPEPVLWSVPSRGRGTRPTLSGVHNRAVATADKLCSCSKSGAGRYSHSRSGVEGPYKALRSPDSLGALSSSEPLRLCGFA
jgi:hypothetical protein